MLRDLLGPTLASDPDRVLLEFGGQGWSARRLDETAARLARALAGRGVEPGDRVACLLPNCPEAVLLYLACFQANFIAVPLDCRYHARQTAYALRHGGARVLLARADRLAELARVEGLAEVEHVVCVGPEPYPGSVPLADLLAGAPPGPPPAAVADDELAVMIYTSGTTSRPKGVTLTRGAVAAGISKFLAVVPLRPDDCALIAAPVSRPFALRTQLLPALRAGARVTLLDRFTPGGYLAALQAPPPKTFLMLLPFALTQVVRHPDVRRAHFAALRLCVVGGDRAPRGLHEEFLKLTGVPLTEQCGMTESGAYALNPPFGRKKPGSIGLPMYGAQVCVLDADGRDVPAGQVGEIVVSSPLAMGGYWNDTAQTRKILRRGCVHTGDLGRYDEDGYLWFVGRKKDIIVRDGSNIAPLEVEAALLEHPDVREACVVGVTDAAHGQEVHAFVTLHPPPVRAGGAEIRRHAAARLAAHQVPAAVHVVGELPRTGTGKVDRDRLAWQAEAGTTSL